MRKNEFITQLLDCRSLMSAVIFNIVRRPDVVDDLVQDCMVSALAARRDFRAEAALRTWAYRIAKNRALMWRRAELVRGTGVPKSCGIDALALNMDDARFHAKRNSRPDKMYEDVEAIERFMTISEESLKPKLRIVAQIKVLTDFTCREIASELNLSVDTVKARMFKARGKLREQYAAA